jgi:methylenetetrahydrofolate dehydrogenase (NADP+)/methenyltetrahydrofolate cyclohydrolase
MTTIIDGRKLRKEILAEVKEEISSLPFEPVFCDVLVGNDPVSTQYVNMKKKTGEEIGVHFHEAFFPFDITTEELVSKIKELNKVKNMCGIIVQLPLPKHLDQQAVLNAVDPHLDVDCLSEVTSEKFYSGDLFLGFPTALACLSLLDSINIDLKDKKIVVLGRGKLVGKPVSALFDFRNLPHEVISSQTENKEKIIKEADIIVSGIGHGKYLRGEMIKNGAIIIDAGTSESNAGIVGDVDLESIEGVASFVSPVPGGVGPVTVAMLFRNVLKVAKSLANK